MSLKNWENTGLIKPHQPSQQEIENLFALADRDIEACQTEGLVTDWRFNIAYNAALKVATAALAASGYQAVRGAHHYRVIQSLALTIGAKTVTVNKFDTFRKKRNVADYEMAGMISDTETEEMLNLAIDLRKEVESWLANNHPHLTL